jgi:hypothetical protein
MKKLEAITLEFARQVIEEETGAPLPIQAPSPDTARARAADAGGNGTDGTSAPSTGSGIPRTPSRGEARLIARDDRKNPLISTFDWTNDAAQRIFRVPVGFMRTRTQERIEELARERAVPAIDLALVEEGIEIGKRMMADMIATYAAPGASPGVATPAQDSAGPSGSAMDTVDPLNGATPAPAEEIPGGNGDVRAVLRPPAVPSAAGGGYLNEVRSR